MKKNKKNYGEFPPESAQMEALGGAASTSDCTGLIPAGSADSAEALDTYDDVRSFSPAEKEKEVQKSRKGSR